MTLAGKVPTIVLSPDNMPPLSAEQPLCQPLSHRNTLHGQAGVHRRRGQPSRQGGWARGRSLAPEGDAGRLSRAGHDSQPSTPRLLCEAEYRGVNYGSPRSYVHVWKLELGPDWEKESLQK